jgi:hypothetical protein
MTTMATIWNGTPQEGLELCDIVKKHCSCTTGVTGDAVRCASHWMLVTDQRALDGLVFARRIALRLREEEFQEFQVRSWVQHLAL